MGLRVTTYVWIGTCLSTVAAIRISDRFCSQLLENMCTQTEALSGELISTSVMVLLALFHKKLIFNFQSDGLWCARSHCCLYTMLSHDWGPPKPASCWPAMALMCVAQWHQKIKAINLPHKLLPCLSHALSLRVSGDSLRRTARMLVVRKKAKGIFWH